jgi:queuine/archaeosine tRNA-ribosyltransferase
MWCESRGNTNAYRYEDNDSGLFQIIPLSFGWVKQNYDVPHWDYPINGSYAQFIPKYNIEVASILVEDIHSRNPYWKVFSSSQWCWEDTNKWIAKWKDELQS